MPRALPLLVLCLLLGSLVGCGGSAADGGADPASGVPADATVYAEATVRPEGDLREDLLAAAGKVLQTDDAEARIRELVDQALASEEAPSVEYEQDIAPWLGERIGLAVLPGGGPEPGYAVLIATTDTEAAQEALDKGLEGDAEPPKPGSHGGVDYVVDQDGDAAGVVEDFVVVAREAEFKRVVDTFGGESLADGDAYREALEPLAGDRLAHFYVNLRGLIELGSRGEPDAAEQLRMFEQFVPLDRLGAMAGAFMADGDRLAFDFTFGREMAEGPLGALSGTEGTPLLADLPADSWVAAGTPDVGEVVRKTIDQFGGALGGAVAQQQLREQLGIDLEQDVLSWMGDVALFVRGTDLASIDGGVVIEVTDADRAAAAIPRLVGAARQSGGVDLQPVSIPGADLAFAAASGGPQPIVLAQSAERVVVAFGEEAAAEALSPASRLGDSELYGAAESALDGIAPSVLVSMASVVEMIEATGSADAEFEQARPYLEAFDVIASGGAEEDGRPRYRVAAGLK